MPGFLTAALEKRAAQLTYDQVAQAIDGAIGTMVAGVAVTPQTALQVSTVLACVKVIAEGCATPALQVLRDTKDGKKEIASNIPEYRLLTRRPNEFQTAYQWIEMMTAHAALNGMGISIKTKGSNGRVRELLPVDRWDVRRAGRWERRFRLYDEYGLIDEFEERELFILKGLQWNITDALSPIALARKAIGLSIATEDTQASMHANSVRTNGFYSVEGSLDPQQNELLTAVLEKRAGPKNVGRPMVLDRSAKWNSTQMTGVDAQHLETRRMQIEEVCRGFNVFPIMIGHSDKTSTFASSEAFFAAHLIHTLTPWHRRWCQAFDEFLLDGSGPLSTKFDTRYLTMGAAKDRAQLMRTGVETGTYTRNEWRDIEGLDPLEGLDDPLTPMNMGTGKNNAPQGDPNADPNA